MPKCRNRRKHNGVCGVHKKRAYLLESDNLLGPPAYERMRQAMDRSKAEAERLEAAGLDILHCQKYMTPFLGVPEQIQPSPFSEFIKLLGESQKELQAFQKVDGAGGLVAMSMYIRYNHRNAPRGFCDCGYCSMGQ